MNIREVLDNIEIKIDCKKNELYEQCKLFSGIIKGSLSKKNKNELGDILTNLKKYKNELNENKDYKKFKFGDNIINLDDEQILFVKSEKNINSRLIAVPGSGKTTCVICRCKYLVDNYILPNRILLLTFNVDACDNMVKRALDLFGFDINIEIRTIDSFCSSIIWKYKTIESNNNYQSNQLNYLNDKNISLNEICLEGEQIMLKYGNIIAQNYDYVMFDEFQDCNDTQFNILKIFEENGCNLSVIGDESQSIYQWRGSSCHYIINIDKIMKNLKTFKITNNYRSSKQIIKSANKSIKNNTIRVDKKMNYLRDNEKKVKIIIKKTMSDQCNEILKIINKKIQKGLKYNDIAILSRNSTPLKIIETFFEKNRIPYIASINEKNTAYDEKLSIIKENNITVSTIHKSKGLEWDTVIIVGLNDNFFPSHMNNNMKNIEEERRLFYVGITRAKNDLLLVGSNTDLPISRFVKEIESKYVEYDCNFKGKDIFGTGDKNIPKLKYSVTELLSLFQGKNIKELRKLDLVPKEEFEERILFDEKLEISDEIKENFFESDFGEFCDRLITRQIMLKNNEDLRDIDTELLINGINLTEKEMEVYQKYDLERLILSKNFKKDEISKIVMTLIVNKEDLNTAQKICSYVKENVEFRRVNTYPDNFMDQLRKSYLKYLDKNKKNEDITKDIYYISLTRKILNERRRLIYRDVYNIFTDKNFDKIKERIFEYCDLFENKETLCKLNMRKMFKIDSDNVSLSGELDMINKDEKMIVDFKCSGSDYKIEWTIQVMLYYSLLIESKKIKKGDIEYICIFNVLKGKEYITKIPENYDCKKIIDYMEDYLRKELKSENYRNDLINDKYCLKKIMEEEKSNGYNKEEKNKNLKNKIDFSNFEINKNCENGKYMSLDVETGSTGTTSDIIQLSYVIYDEKHQEIKRFDKYVKNRMVDNFLYEIHKISTDYLMENGIEFDIIMEEFVKDINNCEYILGHNISSDIKHIKSNIIKYKINLKYDIFEEKKIIDTMKIGKELFDLKTSPSLTKLVELVLKQSMINAHNSLYDCEYTAKCYQSIIDGNIN